MVTYLKLDFKGPLYLAYSMLTQGENPALHLQKAILLQK